jgi:hypothetical protein
MTPELLAVAEPKDSVYLLDNCPHDWLFLQCKAVVSHLWVMTDLILTYYCTLMEYELHVRSSYKSSYFGASIFVRTLTVIFTSIGASWWCWNNSCWPQSSSKLSTLNTVLFISLPVGFHTSLIQQCFEKGGNLYKQPIFIWNRFKPVFINKNENFLPALARLDLK